MTMSLMVVVSECRMTRLKESNMTLRMRLRKQRTPAQKSHCRLLGSPLEVPDLLEPPPQKKKQS